MKAIQLFVFAWILLVAGSCNSSFQPLTGEEGWDMENYPSCYEAGISKGSGKTGSDVVSIRYTKGETIDSDDFGAVKKSIAALPYLGKRIRLSGTIRTQGVTEGAGFWMRVDAHDSILAFDNMDNRLVKGNSDWSACQVVLDVPDWAEQITYGALLIGKGQIWMDNLLVEEVGHETALTGNYIGEKFALAQAKEEQGTATCGRGYVMPHNKLSHIQFVSEQFQKKNR